MTIATRSCPLCGELEVRLHFDNITLPGSEVRFQVVTCQSCGLTYTQPLPDEDRIAQLYTDIYYIGGHEQHAWVGALRSLFHRAVLRWRQSILKGKTGRILDVGCGSGDFLLVMKKAGWEACGLDPSPSACALAAKKGLTVHNSKLADFQVPDRSFDVITMWHVLEHLPEPERDLCVARRVLRDDGLLVVEVPNFTCATARLSGASWYGLDVPRHLQHFTAQTLELLLNEAGFSVLRRYNFHLWDMDIAFYSFMRRLGVLDRLGIHLFSVDYAEAPVLSRLSFVAIGLPVALFSVACSLLTMLATGNGETVTMVCQKSK